MDQKLELNWNEVASSDNTGGGEGIMDVTDISDRMKGRYRTIPSVT